MHEYFALYKPYHMLSQFTNEGSDKLCLKDIPYDFPKDAYPVGRLDYDSEGLLLLTNDTRVNTRLLSPTQGHEREYWVQVEGTPTQEFIDALQKGVLINVDGKNVFTRAVSARILPGEPAIPPRNPPIRYRANIPDGWVALVLTEGKNRQVRKMTAACGFPTLRLVRYRIEEISIDNMQPGDVQVISRNEFYRQVRL